MASNFYIKRNDLSPIIRASLKDANGNYANLGGASVLFKMQRLTGSGDAISSAGSISDASTGTVEYSWQSGDTAISGGYRAEFEVTYSDGKVETFPNSHFIRVEITEDIS